MKVAILITLVISAFAVPAFAGGNVDVRVKQADTQSWQSTGSTQAEGAKWDIRIKHISNHGVGRVFEASTYKWGSGLYCYGPSTTGLRPAKKYDGVVAGDTIVWRMRQDTDYSALFSCAGTFRP